MAKSKKSQIPSDWRTDVDHEVSQLIQLQLLVRRKSYRHYPEVIRRAVRVAYASHFRALLEFFHDGRLRPKDVEKQIGPEAMLDVNYVDLTDPAANPFSRTWSDAELKRL